MYIHKQTSQSHLEIIGIIINTADFNLLMNYLLSIIPLECTAEF